MASGYPPRFDAKCVQKQGCQSYLGDQATLESGNTKAWILQQMSLEIEEQRQAQNGAD